MYEIFITGREGGRQQQCGFSVIGVQTPFLGQNKVIFVRKHGGAHISGDLPFIFFPSILRPQQENMCVTGIQDLCFGFPQSEKMDLFFSVISPYILRGTVGIHHVGGWIVFLPFYGFGLHGNSCQMVYSCAFARRFPCCQMVGFRAFVRRFPGCQMVGFRAFVRRFPCFYRLVGIQEKTLFSRLIQKRKIMEGIFSIAIFILVCNCLQDLTGQRVTDTEIVGVVPFPGEMSGDQQKAAAFRELDPVQVFLRAHC